MGQAQINVRTRACSRTSIARTKQAALTHNVRGKELSHEETSGYCRLVDWLTQCKHQARRHNLDKMQTSRIAFSILANHRNTHCPFKSATKKWGLQSTVSYLIDKQCVINSRNAQCPY